MKLAEFMDSVLIQVSICIKYLTYLFPLLMQMILGHLRMKAHKHIIDTHWSYEDHVGVVIV